MKSRTGTDEVSSKPGIEIDIENGHVDMEGGKGRVG